MKPSYAKKWLPFVYGFLLILTIIGGILYKLGIDTQKIGYWFLLFPIELIGCPQFKCERYLFIIGMALVVIYWHIISCIIGYILEKREKK